MKLRIPTKSNSPLVEGSSGSNESARAQEAAATLAELTASNHLSLEKKLKVRCLYPSWMRKALPSLPS